MYYAQSTIFKNFVLVNAKMLYEQIQDSDLMLISEKSKKY